MYKVILILVTFFFKNGKGAGERVKLTPPPTHTHTHTHTHLQEKVLWKSSALSGLNNIQMFYFEIIYTKRKQKPIMQHSKQIISPNARHAEIKETI